MKSGNLQRVKRKYSLGSRFLMFGYPLLRFIFSHVIESLFISTKLIVRFQWNLKKNDNKSYESVVTTEVSRRRCEMRVLKYYVKNKTLFDTWK